MFGSLLHRHYRRFENQRAETSFLEFLLITIPLYDERKRPKNTTDPAITDTALIVSRW